MPDVVRGTRGRPNGGGTPFTAYSFKNRDVFTTSGQSGKVLNVLVGDDGGQYAVVDFGPDLGRHQVPISSIAYEGNHFVAHSADVRSLPTFVEGQKGVRMVDPSTTINIPGYRLAEGADDSAILVQNAAPQVTVQRPGLLINWEQAPPEVTVHQPTPMVNVRQLQPVIIVRQPPPRITVELDQPEIVVRMPDPEVDVSIAEPQVQVSMAKPLVQVVQPDQPQVKISSGEPLVSLLPRHHADVSIQRDQAEVRYERIGEPQIVVRQLNGGPKVRFEEMSREEALRTTTVTPAGIRISQLESRKVYSRDGEEIGTARSVLTGRDGKHFLVVARSSLLGLGTHKIILPLTDFAMRGDQLRVRNLTAAEIAKISVWDEKVGAYTPAEADRPVQLGLWS